MLKVWDGSSRGSGIYTVVHSTFPKEFVIFILEVSYGG